MTPSSRSEPTAAERFNDVASITAALRTAVREALWRHKRLGESVVIWKDGRVQRVLPEEIPGPESTFWAEVDRASVTVHRPVATTPPAAPESGP